jgi:alpha-L-fucosidase
MPEVDVARLKEFGDELKRVYGASMGSSSADGVVFPVPAKIDRVVLREDLTHGQRVRSFRVRVRAGGLWREVGQGTTIGHKRIVQFEPVLAQEVRLSVEASLAEPRLLKMSAHFGGR